MAAPPQPDCTAPTQASDRFRMEPWSVIAAPVAPPTLAVGRSSAARCGVLLLTQMIGGIGVAIGIAVGALLAGAHGRHRDLRAGPELAGHRRGAARPAGDPDHAVAAGGGPGWRSPTSSAPSGPALVLSRRPRGLAAAAASPACSCSAAGTRPTTRPGTPRSTWPSRPGAAGSCPSWCGPPRSARSPARTSPRSADDAVHRLRRGRRTPGRSRSARSRSLVAAVLVFAAAAARSAADRPPRSPRAADAHRRRTAVRSPGRRGAASGPRRGRSRASPAARLGIASVAVGHLVMVGVMAMTPVHIGEARPPRRHAADRRHRAQPAHRRHVRALAGDRLAHRPARAGARSSWAGSRCCSARARSPGRPGTTRRGSRSACSCSGWAGRARWWPARPWCRSRSAAANRPSVQGLSDLVMGLAGGDRPAR